MATSHPSVLLIIADDWSPIAGCYGGSVIRSPRIDALASAGVTFNHAFCTTPSCAASRASLLTGQHSHTNGQYGHCHGIHTFRTHEWMRTIPAVVGAAGGRSGLIGKSHVLPRSVYPFDAWIERPAADWAAPSRSPRTMAKLARQFIDDCAGRPFYLQVASTYPHRMGDGFGTDMYPDEFESGSYDPDDVPVPDWLPDTPETRQDLAGYYTAVSRWDACVGAVLDALRASGRAEETLVFVLSDHGMPFPAAKASCFEAGHHCPLIVRHPGGIGAGSHHEALVNWLDIAPTVYDWMGIGEGVAPDDLPGRSLLPVLGEPRCEGWDETYWSHSLHGVHRYFPYRVLRHRRYKYVRNLAWELPMPLPTDLWRSPTWQSVRDRGLDMMGKRPTRRALRHDREALFDLEADPLELNNLIADPAHATRLEQMRTKLTQHRVATRDPWLEIDFQEGAPGVEDPGG